MSYRTIILEKQSPYANIKILKENTTGKIRLTLNNRVQFIEGEDEEVYHEALLFPIKEKIKTSANLLVLGGGTGNVLRDIYKINQDIKLTLVDIDKEVVNLGFKDPNLLRINENSFYKAKVKVIIANAINWVASKNKESFDLAVLDLPDPTSDPLRPLYAKPFLNDVKDIIKTGGIATMQAGWNWWGTYLAMERSFGNCHIHEYTMPTLGRCAICWSLKNG